MKTGGATFTDAIAGNAPSLLLQDCLVWYCVEYFKNLKYYLGSECQKGDGSIARYRPTSMAS